VRLCSSAVSLTVLQVANKRWRIDLRSRQAAALMLSAVNLPGGVQVLSCHLAVQHALHLQKSLHAFYQPETATKCKSVRHVRLFTCTVSGMQQSDQL